ncbi:MAG TPA: hypothetical protein VF756_24700 [Thermoanaerobaculia bacterium]
MRSFRITAPGIALALFFLFLAVSLPLSLGRSVRRIHAAFRFAGETAYEERARHFGAEYARAVEEIRRTIPKDGVYLLLDGDEEELGGAIWVRFDLAPRRAVFLGFLKDLKTPASFRYPLIRETRWVVIGYAQKPPRLMEGSELLRRLEAGR